MRMWQWMLPGNRKHLLPLVRYACNGSHLRPKPSGHPISESISISISISISPLKEPFKGNLGLPHKLENPWNTDDKFRPGRMEVSGFPSLPSPERCGSKDTKIWSLTHASRQIYVQEQLGQYRELGRNRRSARSRTDLSLCRCSLPGRRQPAVVAIRGPFQMLPSLFGFVRLWHVKHRGSGELGRPRIMQPHFWLGAFSGVCPIGVECSSEERFVAGGLAKVVMWPCDLLCLHGLLKVFTE